MTDRCAHLPGDCPLCDPRPISVDRAAGCTCPPGRRGVPLRLDDWQPAAGCPVHLTPPPAEPPAPVDPQQVVVRWDEDTRALIAALYGVDHLERVEAAATAYLREQLAAAAQTPAPGAPPDDVVSSGEEGRRPVAGDPGRDPLEATP